MKPSKLKFGILRFAVIIAASMALTQIGFSQPAMSAPPAKVGATVRDCPECPELVRIPSLGQTQEITGRPLYVMRYELTWRQYIAAIKAGSCPNIELDYFEKRSWPVDRLSELEDDYPFLGVSLETFQCYLRFLKARTGKLYRIPTAEEWEHAARAGTHSAYPWGPELSFGDAILPNMFNKEEMIAKFGQILSKSRFGNSNGRTFPVGSLKPNAWGIYDIIGNVSEITSEIIPPDPRCLKNNKGNLSICGAYGSRGFDGFFVSFNGPHKPFPEPNYNLLTERTKASMFGRTISGYRLIRD